ncbi:MAG: heat-inducible transcription repressor HrcA [Leptospiraceae bacterium]|nr:heat-inducible transcription repressor HrcA [Leptospiraceae bacterium]
MSSLVLNSRQAYILNKLVEAYIRHDQPISSLYLTENYDLGCSSATVRSVFKFLDENGYVYAPHRSAGRIPTEKAYRHYVDHFESLPQPNDQDQKMIQAEYLRHGLRIFEILETTSRVLSSLTDTVAITLGPAPEKSILKHIELIDMGQDEILIIIVNRSGTVYSRTVYTNERIAAEYLQQTTRFLNEYFKGMDLAEMHASLINVTAARQNLNRYVPVIGKLIYDNFDAVKGEGQVIIHGLDNLFSRMAQSDYARDRLRELGHYLESRDFVQHLFLDRTTDGSCQIVIEGDFDERLQGISIVTARYKMGEKSVGGIGVIGPNRMDYLRTVSLVEYTRHIISNMITRLTN